MILPYLSKTDRKKKIDQIIPDIYEKGTKVVSLKEMYEKLKAKYIKAGVLDGK